MIKKIFLFTAILVVLFLIFSPTPVQAGYCPNGWCESDEDCNSCEADCGPCPTPPPPFDEGWVPCGIHRCPNLLEWVSYSCYPSCDNPQYCQNDEPCTGDVPPEAECYNDADCFPNNCFCPGNIPCEMNCIGNLCVSDCGFIDGDGDGDGDGEPLGSINCEPESLRVCPPDTGTTVVSWSTQNMTSAQVWLCINDDDEVCPWADEEWWCTETSGTQNFDNVQSDHSYSFRLYAYDTHGILLDSCQVLGLCPTCTVSLPDPIAVPPGESMPVEAMISVQNGLVNRVQFIIDDSNIASINPTTDDLSPYITTVSGISDGETILNARVYLDPGDFLGCTDTALVKVRPPEWFQTKEGDVHSQGTINSQVPSTATNPYFCLDGEGETPGVVSYNGSSSDFGDEAPVSSTDWLANTNFSRKSYNYFYQLLGSPEESITGENDNFPTESGVYFRDGPLNVNNPETVPAGRQLVILVNGKLTINNRIKVNNGGYLVIITSGDIEIDGLVDQIEGIYITDGAISTGNEDNQLTAEGTFIAQKFNLERGSPGNPLNETEPYEEFHYRPDIVMNSHPEIWLATYSWQELAP